MSTEPKDFEEFEEEEDRRWGPRRPKYPPIEPSSPTALERLTRHERRILATLVKKYGREVVVKATKIIRPSRNRGRPRRVDEPRLERNSLVNFTDEERQRLATLVKKYGSATITKAARMVGPSRRRGRPKLEIGGAYYDQMALAELFDELVEEHRSAGSQSPHKDAMRELFFEIAHPSYSNDPVLIELRKSFDWQPPPGNPDDAFRRFSLTTKRKLPQGRRDLEAVKKAVAAMERHRGSLPRKKAQKKSGE